jgi:hypothetical protein
VSVARALEDVVTRFRSVQLPTGPLRAFSDPNDVTPPCVFVPLPDLAYRFSRGFVTATWHAYIVGPNAPGQSGTVENIATVLDAIERLFPWTAGDLYTLTLPGGGPPAQSYRLEWVATIPIGESANA